MKKVFEYKNRSWNFQLDLMKHNKRFIYKVRSILQKLHNGLELAHNHNRKGLSFHQNAFYNRLNRNV